MSRLMGILIVIGLLSTLVASPALAAPPFEKYRTTPEDLPIVKVPGSHWPGRPLHSGSLAGQLESVALSAPIPDMNNNMLAVVIGIADYPGANNDLWHPDEDAVEMKQALVEKYGFPEENVWLLLNGEANLETIETALKWMADYDNAESSIVFFFSGHGFQRSDRDGFDADTETDGKDEGIVSYEMYGLSDGWLLEQFQSLAFESQHIAMIFAACHAGGFFDDSDVDLQQLGGGRVIPAACEANQVTWDFLFLNNTLFGYYFIDQAILGNTPIPGYEYDPNPADVNGDGVSIEEALLYAEPLVLAESTKIPPWNWPRGVPKETDPDMWDAYPEMAPNNVAELILGVAAPPPPPDTTPPAAVTDLATSNPSSSSITLTWTATGDDGVTGTATYYDIRYLVREPVADFNWITASQCEGEPAPKDAGLSESFTVTGLASSPTYYFAIKTGDEVPNWAPISNSPFGTTTAAPTAYLSITMSLENRSAGKNTFTTAVATVRVLDGPTPDTANPIVAATVSGSWDGLTSDKDSELTGADGIAIIKSNRVKNASGMFRFTVEVVAKDGVNYVLNGEISDSIWK